jgi:hypothetical protein
LTSQFGGFDVVIKAGDGAEYGVSSRGAEAGSVGHVVIETTMPNREVRISVDLARAEALLLLRLLRRVVFGDVFGRAMLMMPLRRSTSHARRLRVHPSAPVGVIEQEAIAVGSPARRQIRGA